MTTTAAATHLTEMRDLAERILAMGNTLATYDSERPETNVTVWDLGRELAELVQHYDPERPIDAAWCVNPDPESTLDAEVYLFEDEEDAQNFCAAHGGHVTSEVIFFRGNKHTADIIACARGETT